MRSQKAVHGLAMRARECAVQGEHVRVQASFFPSSSGPKRFFAAVAASASLVATTPTVAQLVVTDGGTAAFAYPINVPPGAAGLAPTIALSYTGADLSPVGKGWTLRATSSITRCAANKTVDGVTGRVSFAPSDKLCLDGMRLIQTDASGAPLPFPQQDDAKWLGTGVTREFRTEGDNFVRVRAYDRLVSNDANSPPKYFKAWTRDGRVYEFGPGPANASAAVVRIATDRPTQAWVLTRISDASGNFIAYTYETQDAPSCTRPFGSTSYAGYAGYSGNMMDWRLSRIDYSGNSVSGQLAQNSVVLTYSPLACGTGDISHAWHMGHVRTNLARLDDVTTYVGTTAVSKYKLSYSTTPLTKRTILGSVAECNGAGTACKPATEFGYTPGGVTFQSSTTFTKNKEGQANGLATEVLHRTSSSNPRKGTIVADFNGDGRDDLLVWSDLPAENRLYLSEGLGNYRRVPSGALPAQFNLGNEHLFISRREILLKDWDRPGVTYSENILDHCADTVVADFNGDGLADLLRTPGRSQCEGAGVDTRIFLSNGDGSFTKINPFISLSTSQGSWISGGVDNYRAYLVGDIDRDGKADILKLSADNAKYNYNGANFAACQAYDADNCGATWFKSAGDGTFVPAELTWAKAVGATNPSSPDVLPLPGYSIGGYTHFVPFVFKTINGFAYNVARLSDVDGDGVLDLYVGSSQYLGSSAAGFMYVGQESSYVRGAVARGDYNGDGRLDYLGPSTDEGVTSLGWGGSGPSWEIAGGNDLANPSIPNTTTIPGTVGTRTISADVDGDGRTDVVTYRDQQAIGYMRSLGNGWFEPRKPLDGVAYIWFDVNFLPTGNFSGSGSLELLIPSKLPDSVQNEVSVKVDPIPPDTLASVKTPNGITTTITYEPLTKTTRYAGDRGTAFAAASPQVEVVPPMAVAKTQTVDSGVGTSKLVTEFAYRSYREDHERVDAGRYRPWQIDQSNFQGDTASRRSLGFREVRKETVAADGSSKLTSSRQAIQIYPYGGRAAIEQMYLGAMSPIGNPQSGALLASTENVYCDQTSAAGAENTATVSAPCPSTSKIRKPYVRKSTQTGADLNGTALPTTTTTTTYTGGYPTLIQVDTSGTGPAGAQTFMKKQAFEYWPDNIAGDNWLLGLVKKSTVTNTVPDSLNAITTSAGTAPKATATSGQ